VQKNLVILTAGLILTGCATPKAIDVATGLSAQVLCTQVYVAGQEAQPVFDGFIGQISGLKQAHTFLGYQLNAADRSVTARFAGTARSRAVYTPGRGCTLIRNGVDPAPISLSQDFAYGDDPIHAPDGRVSSNSPKIEAALSEAFHEPKGGPLQAVKAIVIIYNGHIVSERYAAGFGPDTPIHSWSVAKSVTNALLGILAHQGQITANQSAPVPAWQAQGDPRAAITIEQLLRHTSGQPFGSDNNGFDPSSQMLFATPDTYANAVSANFKEKPGTAWSYTDGNYAILGGILAGQIGGGPQRVADFARTNLFGPASMKTAQIAFDEVGTPNLAAFVTASARDWARFGELYRNDGVLSGQRILPEGWVAMSSAPTPQAPLGYGAGFWTNLGESQGAVTRRSWGAPAGSFFANGDYGQTILIAPAQNLVIARFGFSQGGGAANMRKTLALAYAVIEALPQKN
jgi:CubicO group peptidase (beta-lactamase class C family)